MVSFLTALGAGALFGAGLVLSGMAMPSKVLGFLDVAGAWDPSLAFVMFGAWLVYAPLFRFMVRSRGPSATAALRLPSVNALDARLVSGAALFGVGWGLAGMCPGPALVVAGALIPDALVFVGTMGVGVLAFSAWDARRTQPVRAATGLPPDG